MEYYVEDLIVPLLAKQGRLTEPCPIRIRITDEHVFLYIGPRDWQWEKETGKIVGSGTGLCSPFLPDELPRSIPE